MAEVKETMLTNIYREKEILEKIFNEFKEKNKDLLFSLKEKQLKNILILATGSSMNAALTIKYTLEENLKTVVFIEEPFNYTNYGMIDNEFDLIIGISQSGRSASTIKALEKIKSKTKAETLVITSNLSSPIVEYSDYILELNMEIENVGFVTKGFTATVLNIILFSLYLGKMKELVSVEKFNNNIFQIKKIIEKIPKIILKTENYFETNKLLLEKGERFICIGYGPSTGIAKEFETKFTETVRYPSQGFELESYMHGPYLEANKKHYIFYLNSKGIFSQRLLLLKQYMEKYVGFSSVIGFAKEDFKNINFELNEEIDENLLVILLVIPIQILSYRIANLKGINLEVRIFDDFDKVLKSKIN
ncbi:SIS domain-containing protein [Fusobacterium sp. SYSU M8D902]|uniref:SIS domain-containing protein n=1 Tax=Fusobacterium sp. SYSU M8D902 TaxID=3159562 RepID=UPI0032E4DA37